MTKAQDEAYMARAIQLARRGLYTTDPNPRVGCVLVKHETIIAKGWHVQAGREHAEINALARTEDARGATAYVSLEPCSHHGRTGPCCEALIEAGIARVVIAMQDPNPLVSGNGINKLRLAGIDVECGILQQDAEVLNRGFIKRMRQQLPFVRSKLAMSLDGRTAMASGESQWITSPQSRTDVQYWRAQSSAVMTGVNTVLADDPLLNVRLSMEVKQPIRVILDSNLRMPLNAKMLVNDHDEVWVITCSQDDEKINHLRQAGAQVFGVLSDHHGRVDLRQVMTLLAERQINSVWVEAGATLNGALMQSGLVDEWLVYMAPCILGDAARGLLKLPGMDRLADKQMLSMQQVRKIGPDLRLTLTQN